MRHFLIRLYGLLLLSTLFSYGYTFEMSCDKSTLMVGQKIHVTLTLRYHNLEDYEIDEPNFEGFQTTLLKEDEVKENNSSKNNTTKNNTTWKVTQEYILMAQSKGSFTLSSPMAHLESIAPEFQERYNRNKYLVKTTIKAKPCTLTVAPLPEGLKVTGEYRLNTTIDKKTIKAGEPLHFMAELQGEGNLKNLDFFHLTIPHTTIYETKGTVNQKHFDIVAEHNYTIPSLTLNYYNQGTKSVELLSSQGFNIEVIGAVSSSSNSMKIVWVIIGLFGFSSWFFLYWFFLQKRAKNVSFIKELKQCKTKEALLEKVAPYLNQDRALKRLIFSLEALEDRKFKKVKKEIITLLNQHIKEQK